MADERRRNGTTWLIPAILWVLVVAVGALIGLTETNRREREVLLTERVRMLEGTLPERIRLMEFSQWAMCVQHQDLERLLRSSGSKLVIDCSFLVPKRP